MALCALCALAHVQDHVSVPSAVCTLCTSACSRSCLPKYVLHSAHSVQLVQGHVSISSAHRAGSKVHCHHKALLSASPKVMSWLVCTVCKLHESWHGSSALCAGCMSCNGAVCTLCTSACSRSCLCPKRCVHSVH